MANLGNGCDKSLHLLPVFSYRIVCSARLCVPVRMPVQKTGFSEQTCNFFCPLGGNRISQENEKEGEFLSLFRLNERNDSSGRRRGKHVFQRVCMLGQVHCDNGASYFL